MFSIRSSIKNKIIALAISVIAPMMAVTLYISFMQFIDQEAKTALSGLMNFVDAKQQGVIRFLGSNEKLARQLATLVEQPDKNATRAYFRTIIETDRFDVENHPFKDEIKRGQRIIPTLQVYRAIDWVQDDIIVLSSDSTREGQSYKGAALMQRGYSEVYFDGGIPTLTFGAPTIGKGQLHIHADARFLTVIINGEIGNLEGNMGAFYLAGEGKTFNYYIVNRDNIMITESRIHHNAVLRQKGSEFPWRLTLKTAGIECHSNGRYLTNADHHTGCQEAMG